MIASTWGSKVDDGVSVLVHLQQGDSLLLNATVSVARAVTAAAAGGQFSPPFSTVPLHGHSHLSSLAVKVKSVAAANNNCVQ